MTLLKASPLIKSEYTIGDIGTILRMQLVSYNPASRVLVPLTLDGANLLEGDKITIVFSTSDDLKTEELIFEVTDAEYAILSYTMAGTEFSDGEGDYYVSFIAEFENGRKFTINDNNINPRMLKVRS